MSSKGSPASAEIGAPHGRPEVKAGRAERTTTDLARLSACAEKDQGNLRRGTFPTDDLCYPVLVAALIMIMWPCVEMKLSRIIGWCCSWRRARDLPLAAETNSLWLDVPFGRGEERLRFGRMAMVMEYWVEKDRRTRKGIGCRQNPQRRFIRPRKREFRRGDDERILRVRLPDVALWAIGANEAVSGSGRPAYREPKTAAAWPLHHVLWWESTGEGYSYLKRPAQQKMHADFARD